MRFWSLAAAVIFCSASLVAQKQQFREKPVHSGDKELPKTSVAPAKGNSGATSKELNGIEKEKAPRAPRTAAAKKQPVTTAKVQKDKNTPINFGGGNGGGSKTPGMVSRGRNPYKGRLKEKGKH